MGNIAFVFSGQGAQKVGMGYSFYEKYPEVRELYDNAEKIRPGTLGQMFEGSDEELRQTRNTQPCLYLADIAPALALSVAGIQPNALAGFSLGEIPALAFGGAFSYEEGFKISTLRGKLMAQAAESNPATMAAVLKLENNEVEDICSKYKGIYPANCNCPGQVVVSGAADIMPSFCEDVKAAGGRTIMLNVSGGFHSPFMEEAAKGFSKELENFEITLPKIPTFSNFTSNPYEGNPRELLVRQITGSVRWEETIKNMVSVGIDTFIECGIGGVLQKLILKIAPGCRTFCVENAEQSEEVAKEVEK